jgi:hypothetical protein
MLPTTQNLILLATEPLADVLCGDSVCRVSERITNEFHGLWPMVGLVGAALMLAGLFQAFRRRAVTAIFALLIGGLGLGLFLSLGRAESRSIATVLDLSRPPIVTVPAVPAPPRPAPPKDLECGSSGSLVLRSKIIELGGKFRSKSSKDIQRYIEKGDEDAIAGVSEVYASADEAQQEAIARAAEGIRRRYLPKLALHTKLPIEKLDKHAEEVDGVIADVLRRLSDSEQVQISIENVGTPKAPRHRAAVRVEPENLAAELRDKVSEFVDTRLTPLMRRTAGTLLSMFALCILLYLAYVFVDVGTRGHFTWTLRVAAALAFVGICGALWYLGA